MVPFFKITYLIVLPYTICEVITYNQDIWKVLVDYELLYVL